MRMVSVTCKYNVWIGLVLFFVTIILLWNRMSSHSANRYHNTANVNWRTQQMNFLQKNWGKYTSTFETRRKRVEEVCGKNFPQERLPDKEALLSQKEPFNRNLSLELLVSEELKVIWCRVPNVAGAFWDDVFLEMKEAKAGRWPLVGPKFANNGWSLLRDYPPEKALEMLENYKKVMWVRKPHVRLISAYRKNIQSSEIADQFKTNETKNDGKETIEDFLTYLKNLSDISGRENLNEHWKPVYAICDACKLPWLEFTYIGKFENISSEGQYIMHHLQPNKIKRVFSKKSPTTTDEVAEKLLSGAPVSLVRHVLALYREDYELFQYEPFKL